MCNKVSLLFFLTVLDQGEICPGSVEGPGLDVGALHLQRDLFIARHRPELPTQAQVTAEKQPEMGCSSNTSSRKWKETKFCAVVRTSSGKDNTRDQKGKKGQEKEKRGETETERGGKRVKKLVQYTVQVQVVPNAEPSARPGFGHHQKETLRPVPANPHWVCVEESDTKTCNSPFLMFEGWTGPFTFRHHPCSFCWLIGVFVRTCQPWGAGRDGVNAALTLRIRRGILATAGWTRWGVPPTAGTWILSITHKRKVPSFR